MGSWTISMYIFYFFIEHYLFLDNSFDNIKKRKELLKHLLYLLIGCLFLIIINYNNIFYIIIYFILHLTIDYFIKWLNARVERENMIYILYQGLHIILIYLIGKIQGDNHVNYLSFMSSELLRWILFIIVIFKPVNTSFKILFQKYAPKESDAIGNTVEGAGALIGNLERLLIAILMYYDQFGAIGLVFTAKSVARFDKISKDPIFAEYYLIGSLYSIISVLLFYGILLY